MSGSFAGCPPLRLRFNPEALCPNTGMLAAGVTYMPFGPLSSLTYGNGLTLTKTYTQDYLISSILVQNASTSNVVVDRAYTFGDGINITGIADNVNPARSEAYVYTASNRLQQGGGIWGTLSWSYDGVGNRTSEALSPGYSNTYNYAGSNNQLASLTQGSTTIRAFSYDGAGNLITDGNGATTYNYGYNNSGRLATLTVGSTPQSLGFCREYREQHKRDRSAADCADYESENAHSRQCYTASRPMIC
jgi:YD repeat-containing protein